MTNESIGIDKIASELRESAGIIRNLIQGKDAPQLAEFVDAVENYAKYIDSIMKENRFDHNTLRLSLREDDGSFGQVIWNKNKG